MTDTDRPAARGLDPKMLAWAHAAVARAASGRRLPVLWMFTDARRLPDPRPAVARLPSGIAGVVLRHDGEPGRAALGHDLARLCRSRRLVLVVAGDTRLAAALGAGVHLRNGRWPGVPRRSGRALITSSAHGRADLVRARRAGADLIFLSPVFPTSSHPGARVLGPARWARLARSAGVPMAALGGVSSATIRRLPRGIGRAIGAIGSLT